MAMETPYPAEHETAAVELDRLQAEAAQEAPTIGSFRRAFRRDVEVALNDRMIDEDTARARLTAVDEAADGHENIRLDTTEQGVLGYNRIGAGREGMRISRDMLANVADEGAATDVAQTVAHEAAHGEQAQLHGTLEIDGREVDHLLLYEGDAEIQSNRAIGKSDAHRRIGQPRETYAEGQELVLKLQRRVTRQAVDRALRGDGDLSKLQEAYDLAA